MSEYKISDCNFIWQLKTKWEFMVIHVYMEQHLTFFVGWGL